MKRRTSQRGFVALISAVLMSAILIPLAIDAGMDGFFARFDALGAFDKTEARALAHSCVESALLALATSTDLEDYAVQNQTVAVDSRHSCTIASISHSGSQATISAYASVGSSYSSSSATVSLVPQIAIISWDDSP